MDMELTEELKRILRCQGADLVGIGDMSKVENCNFKRGVAGFCRCAAPKCYH